MTPPRFLHQCLWLRVFCLDDEGRIKSSCRLFHCSNICLHSFVCACLKLSLSIIFGTTSQSLDWTVLTSDYLFAPVMSLWIPLLPVSSLKWTHVAFFFPPLLKWLNLIKDERGGVFESSSSAVFENIFFFFAVLRESGGCAAWIKFGNGQSGLRFHLILAFYVFSTLALILSFTALHIHTLKCLKGRSLHAHTQHGGVIDSSQIKIFYSSFASFAVEVPKRSKFWNPL